MSFVGYEEHQKCRRSMPLKDERQPCLAFRLQDARSVRSNGQHEGVVGIDDVVLDISFGHRMRRGLPLDIGLRI